MTEFHIRLAEPRDLSGVDALLARSYPKLLKTDYAPSVLVTALPIITRAKPDLMACGSYFVAETFDHQIIGAGGWTRSTNVAGQGDIRHVVSDDRHLRQGIAKGVLLAALFQAKSAGVSKMRCWSTITAVPFYKSMGFEEIGPIEVMLAKTVQFPAVDMQQIL